MENHEIAHFSHEHPLVFKDLEEKDYAAAGPGLIGCSMCADPVEIGPSYSCNQCSHFIVHKSCADLPREFLQHPAHCEHPLILQRPVPSFKRPSLRPKCEACQSGYFDPNTFIYSCSQCSFRLHLECCFNLLAIIAHENHIHKFSVNWKTMSRCDVCCTDGAWYMCSICQMTVHKECASLESEIKITAHHHPLKLNWFFQGNRPMDEYHCKICYKRMPYYISSTPYPGGAAYTCQTCSYVAHTSCANRHRQHMPRLEDNKDSCKTMVDDDSKTLMSTPIVELQQVQMTIKHFSHDQHSLTLQVMTESDSESNCRCDGCMGSISTGDAFYSCAESPEEESSSSCRRRFFLHKRCAQLPRQVLHPLHPHELTLLSRVPNSIDGVFECHVCQMLSQGFAYTCSACDIYLDLQCSTMLLSLDSVKLTHDAHPDHPLFFNAEASVRGCHGCHIYNRIFFFSCIDCNFNLCIACVKLPLTTRHRYDIHPLKLTCASTEYRWNIKGDQHYCEICEGKRNPNYVFYYCTDCDFDCHPHCVLGTSYPQIKLGGTYKLHNDHVHPHPVTLVEKRKSPIRNDKRNNILPCQVCRKPCKGLTYECKQCNINIHRECSPRKT